MRRTVVAAIDALSTEGAAIGYSLEAIKDIQATIRAGFVVAIATLSGIGSAHVQADGASGANAFFAGGLYEFNLRDAVFRRRAVRSRLSLSDFVTKLPETYQEIQHELGSEIMTLAYFRDLKLLRQRLAFGVCAAALTLAAAGFAI